MSNSTEDQHEIRTISFEKPRYFYIFFLIGNVLAFLLVNYFGYLIFQDLLYNLIFSSIYIYLGLLYLQLGTAADLGYKFHLLILIPLVLVPYEVFFGQDYFSLILISSMTIVVAFVAASVTVIFDYTTHLSYDGISGELKIVHHKLWITFDEIHSVPKDSDLELIIAKNQLAYHKSQAFHKVRYRDQGLLLFVEIAPIFVSGFELANKIYYLFQPHTFEFKELSAIYPKFIFAKFGNGVVSLPNKQVQTGYMSMDEFLEDKSKKHTIAPLMQSGSVIIPALISALILIFILLYQSYSSNFQDLNILDYGFTRASFLLFYFVLSVFLIYGLGKPYLAVNTGDLEIISNTEYYRLIYHKKWFGPVTLEIAKAFNPQVTFEDNQYIMVILNEMGGIFYRQPLFELI